MDRWRKTRAVELETTVGFFVHEHLVRERSSVLAEKIDNQKKKGEEKVVISIHAESRYVSHWIDWLYGQPMFPQWGVEMHDDVLEDFVEMCRLAHLNEDYECINLCLDAILDLLLEGSSELGEPFDKLKPLLDALEDYDRELILDMIIHAAVYGPAADSGQTKWWLGNLAGQNMFNDWIDFWQQMGLEFATKAAAQASGNLESIPDFMAEHFYHLSETRGELCCGREVPRTIVGRKRPLDEEE